MSDFARPAEELHVFTGHRRHRMKHAGPQTLAKLEPLLSRIRQHAALVERTPGCFYRKSKAHLHFHEDPSGTFADIKLAGSGFTRVGATTQEEQARLLSLIERSLEQP
jgi:hypothetical protein